MLSAAIQRLEQLLNETPALLLQFSDEKASEKPRPGKWSKKEIMGHLVDSATNNHQRFVRLQLQNGIELWPYAQNEWVNAQQYNRLPWAGLVQLWLVYNQHLLHLMRQVKKSSLEHTGTFPDGKEHTLLFIMTDYVRHLEHHLQQTGIDYAF